MNEPTQEIIVSELRCRVRVSIGELTQVLGLQFGDRILSSACRGDLFPLAPLENT